MQSSPRLRGSVAAQRCGQSLRSFPHTSPHSTSWRRPGQEGASQGGSTEALSTALERTAQGPPCSVKTATEGLGLVLLGTSICCVTFVTAKRLALLLSQGLKGETRQG